MTDSRSLNTGIAGVEDAAELAALINRAYSAAPGASGWVGDRTFQDGERTDDAEVLDAVRRPGSQVLMLRLGTTAVACCALETVGTGQHLSLFAVDPAVQSGGLGRTLLAWAEQVAIDEGAEFVFLEAMEHHRALREWYARAGYADTGDRVGLNPPAFPTPVTLVLMRKQLGTESGSHGRAAADPSD
ncbi:GNAT family N-acetyltransferase [Curtobacterium flaccumfaciens]|uniref:GNAT family N-acetyltransferase n=1 Tax=Curtobacterium flaccumfaciens TaxID=2035 RepID=UPI003991934A